MIILDTSFLVAYHNERDVNHAAAGAIMSRFLTGEWGDGWLLEYVYLEVVTVLRCGVEGLGWGHGGWKRRHRGLTQPPAC